MEATVVIDGINNEWVDAHDSLNIAHGRVKPFHFRHDVEQFVNKIVTYSTQ